MWACGHVARGRGTGSQLSSVCRAGSSSARTAAAGAALAEAVGPDPSPPWTLDCAGSCLSRHPFLGAALPQSSSPGPSRSMVSACEGFGVHRL